MRIAIGSDHGGYELKEILKKHIITLGDYTLDDVGTYSEESVDYPEYGAKVAKSVTDGNSDKGIVICGTGIGISIAANKINGARAALCHTEHDAEMTRRHNDSNILALGGRTTDQELAKKITKTWLETEFEGDRHQRRIEKIHELESN